VLFELLLRAPPAERFDADVPKPVLKRVLERHLPHDVLYRPKQGFAVHLESFLNDAFWAHLAELFASRAAAELFDRAALDALVRSLRAGGLAGNDRVKAMYKIWIVAILLHWKVHVLDAPRAS
jgi:asparagine synthase (glutamine-hydrolysing)